MEIKINKEIRDYKETIVLGLNIRQFIFSVGGLVCSVGSYFLLKDLIGKEATSWICIASAVPLAAFGFFNKNGLSLEQYLFAVITSEWILPGKRTFQTPAERRAIAAAFQGKRRRKNPEKIKKQR